MKICNLNNSLWWWISKKITAPINLEWVALTALLFSGIVILILDSCFSPALPKSRLWPDQRSALRQQACSGPCSTICRSGHPAHVRDCSVRGGAAHPAELSRRPHQTQNFTGPRPVQPQPGGGPHDRHRLRLEPRGLPERIQTQGKVLEDCVLYEGSFILF